jgi:hypothetical protein
MDITLIQYCLLERIARSRYNGEKTIGVNSLLDMAKDSTLLFYQRYRKGSEFKTIENIFNRGFFSQVHYPEVQSGDQTSLHSKDIGASHDRRSSANPSLLSRIQAAADIYDGKSCGVFEDKTQIHGRLRRCEKFT